MTVISTHPHLAVYGRFLRSFESNDSFYEWTYISMRRSWITGYTVYSKTLFLKSYVWYKAIHYIKGIFLEKPGHANAHKSDLYIQNASGKGKV